MNDVVNKEIELLRIWVISKLIVISLAMLNALKAKFYDLTSRSFSKMGNARFLEQDEFEKKENIKNVVFEEEYFNDIDQVLVPITIQETIPVIENNIQINVPNIVPEQDYDERSIRERRNAISNDYNVFLQEHEDDVGLTKDDQ
ncbi:hypothetical protein CR513_00176, partial [Mucuna pruriens]